MKETREYVMAHEYLEKRGIHPHDYVGLIDVVDFSTTTVNYLGLCDDEHGGYCAVVRPYPDKDILRMVHFSRLVPLK